MILLESIDHEYIRILKSQTYTKLDQKGQHQTEFPEVPTYIFIGGDIILLDFFLSSTGEASHANFANFVQFMKNSFA